MDAITNLGAAIFGIIKTVAGYGITIVQTCSDGVVAVTKAILGA